MATILVTCSVSRGKMVAMSTSKDGCSVWDEVADLYAEGVSPFGLFSVELVKVAKLNPGERVVDLGTGNGQGLFAAATAVAPAVVTGVDTSNAMLLAAKRRLVAAGMANTFLSRMDVSKLGFPDGSFDVAIASSVFQFVGYATEILVEWRRVIRPGGRLVLSVPQHPAKADTMSVLVEAIQDKAPGSALGRLPQGSERQRPDVPTMCHRGGFREVSCSSLHLHVELADFEDWWAIQWSHGIRRVLGSFDPPTLEAVKHETAERLEGDRNVRGMIPFDAQMLAYSAIV